MSTIRLKTQAERENEMRARAAAATKDPMIIESLKREIVILSERIKLMKPNSVQRFTAEAELKQQQLQLERVQMEHQ